MENDIWNALIMREQDMVLLEKGMSSVEKTIDTEQIHSSIHC